MYLSARSDIFSASNQSHVDRIGGFWLHACTDEALCWHGSIWSQEHVPWGRSIWVTLFPRPERPLICGYWQTPPDPLDAHRCPLMQCWTNRWSPNCSENKKSWKNPSLLLLACWHRRGWVCVNLSEMWLWWKCEWRIFVPVMLIWHTCSLDSGFSQVFPVKKNNVNERFLFFPHHRLLWVLHQMFRRGAVRIAGGYNPLLLWRRPVLRVRPRGSDRHRHHSGDSLLQGHQRPRHADWRVSVVSLAVIRRDHLLCYAWKCVMTSSLD